MPTTRKLDWSKVARAAKKAAKEAGAGLVGVLVAPVYAVGSAIEWTKDHGWPAVRDAAVSAYKGTKEALGTAF
ncbi:hypothetical protein, partial [Legionella cincinnatiensis]